MPVISTYLAAISLDVTVWIYIYTCIYDIYKTGWVMKLKFWEMDTIDQIHKPHNAPVPYLTIHHSEPFLFWMVHCGIRDMCIVGFVRLVYR